MRPDGSLTERFRCPLFEAGRSSEGGGLNGTPYYDTTVARKHDYWKRFNDLPHETKDIKLARHHLRKYGFCLIEDAMSERQCSYMRRRLEEQAEAERECGLADMTPHFHIMWTLVNKGDCFAKCIEVPSRLGAGRADDRAAQQRTARRRPLRLFLRLQHRSARQLSAEPASGFGCHPSDPDARRTDPRQHRVHHAGRERGQRRHPRHPHEPPAGLSRSRPARRWGNCRRP